MEFKAVKFGLRFYFAMGLRRVHKVRGICSNLDDAHHFLIWDFDNVDLALVELDLLAIQHHYKLPQIDIWRTSRGYHAYCFCICNWVECREIIAATEFVDQNYLAVGIARGYFTLRVSQVPGEESFKPISQLKSIVPQHMSYKDIITGVEYSRAAK